MAVLPDVKVVGIRGVSKKIDKISAFLTSPIYFKPLLDEIGQFAMTKIKVRTEEGRNVSGRYFKPYSKLYKKFREEHGHPTNRVNLTFTGSMLASMTYDIKPGDGGPSVKVFFLNTEDETGTKNPEKAFFLNEERRFFALSENDIKEIKKTVKSYYRRIV